MRERPLRQPRLLIVDDEALERHRYQKFASFLGYQAVVCANLTEAKDHLRAEGFDILMTDLYLSENDPQGLELLQFIQDENIAILPLAMSSDLHHDTIAQAKKLGALEFIRKPLSSADEMSIVVEQARERRHLQLLSRAPQNAYQHQSFVKYPDGIVLTQEQNRLAGIVARSGEVPVVIYGETGTGKEEIAKLIHRRRQELAGPIPFVAINCANLNSDLASSLLFGHRKGAFSGADRNTIGLIGEAHGGILFLDEIHTLSIASQQKLLRFLNDGQYTRLGDTALQHADVQIIVASTMDLDQQVDSGAFLLDLRARLTGIEFMLLPLRERKLDIPDLIDLYVAKRGVTIAPEERKALIRRCQEFYWRGNIRQLYKALDTMVVMAMGNDEPVSARYLPVHRSMLDPSDVDARSLVGGSVMGKEFPELQTLERALAEDLPLCDVMDHVERAVIRACLSRHRRIGDVYKALGIGRNTLDVKRKKHGL